MKNSPQLVVVQVAKYFNLEYMKQTGISDSKQTQKNAYSKQKLDMHYGSMHSKIDTHTPTNI